MNEINLEDIGEKISLLRKELGYTMRDLSEYTGLSIGFLSNLETGKNSPTLENLQRVAVALQTDLVELVTDEKSKKVIIRKEEMKIYEYDRQKMTVEGVNFGYDRQMYEKITIKPGAKEKGAVSRHLYPEICMVQSGILTVELDNEVYELNEGDSIYIAERKHHRIYNRHNMETVSIWVHQKNH
nr:helix-turn-helix domain-containing protein [uncultured Clostridium sp.]